MEQFNWEQVFEKTPQSFHKTVQSTLNALPNKKENRLMKSSKMSFKKAAIISMVATLAIGTTVFATGKISVITQSTKSTADFHTLPTSKEVEKSCGVSYQLLETFSNGYQFDSGNYIELNGMDDSNKKVDQVKGINLEYQKENENVSFSMNPEIEDALDTGNDTSSAYGDMTLYYNNQNYKFEPDNYKMTEQDKADEASGKYVFSLGSQKEEIENFQSIYWVNGTTEYSITAKNSQLTQQDLQQMASEVIDANTK